MGELSLTVGYDPKEDRLLLDVRDEAGEQVLLLTRRLTFRLLVAMAEQIRHSQSDQRVAEAGLQNELLSMKHASALSHIRSVQAERPAPKQSRVRALSRLITQIEIIHDSGGRILVFKDGAEVVSRIPFDARQLHWLMGRLVDHARNAEWHQVMSVPEWIGDEGRANLDSNQVQVVRSLH